MYASTSFGFFSAQDLSTAMHSKAKSPNSGGPSPAEFLRMTVPTLSRSSRYGAGADSMKASIRLAFIAATSAWPPPICTNVASFSGSNPAFRRR